MGDLIERQAAIDALHGYFDGMLETDTWSPCDVYGLIEVLPSAQPEEASMILGTTKDGVRLWYQCSACGEPVNADDNYCCNCGRKFING